MRVIAGTFRSRLITAPPGTLTRPTSDRLRETLFNMLGPRVVGSRFADLYAGTGAVGIEAISRGAAHVWFAEVAPPAIAALRANLRSLDITSAFTLEDRGTGAFLERLAKLAGPRPNSPPSDAAGRAPNPMDILFLDPPYEAANEYAAALGFLGSQRGLASLAADAVVVAEHSSKIPLPERFGGLRQTRSRRQGDVSLTFFAPEDQGAAQVRPSTADPDLD